MQETGKALEYWTNRARRSRVELVGHAAKYNEYVTDETVKYPRTYAL